MAKTRDGATLRHVQALWNAGTFAGLTDRQLLERYASRGGEPSELAFAALVERHGAMVLRVCRDILRDEHGAQDAFQATFLVLARRSAALRPRDTLGPWLHEVAARVALSTRSAAARRLRHERKAAELAASSVDAPPWDETGSILHEEVGRLPDAYRAAIVLCCLQGLTHEQAARRLGCPLGTVLSRVARGRERLRGRLMRRGLAPGAVLIALAAPGRSATAVPPALADATIRGVVAIAATGSSTVMSGLLPASAAALAQGVLRTMMLTKLKIAAAGLLSAAVVAGGAGLLAGQTTIRPADAPASDSASGRPAVAPGRTIDRQPVDPEEWRRLAARRIVQAARQRLEAQHAFLKEGRITIDRYLDASTQLWQAEVQASTSQHGRIAAARDRRDRVKQVEADERKELESGRGTVADVAEAVHARQQAEFDLADAEKADGRSEFEVLRGRVTEVEAKLDRALKAIKALEENNALEERKRRRD